MDVKFLERIPGTRRRLFSLPPLTIAPGFACSRSTTACNQTTAIGFVDEVLRRLPFRVQVVQTDNGAEFQSHFHWHLQASTSATCTFGHERRT